MKPEVNIGGIVVLVRMPGKDRVIGHIDKDEIFKKLSEICNKVEIDGPYPNGVYAITVDCTWKNPGGRTKLVKDLVEKYYTEKNEN